MLRLDFAQYVCVTSKHFEQKGQQLRRKRWPSHHLYRFNWGRRVAEKFVRSEIGLKPCRDSAARKVKEQENGCDSIRSTGRIHLAGRRIRRLEGCKNPCADPWPALCKRRV